MPLVAGRCTQCGAKLELDSSNETGYCPFCNTEFIIEKAIQYFINNISDEVDNLAKSGDTFIKLNDYDKADCTFTKISEMYPFDYRGWWGLVRVRSRDFTNIGISKDEFDEIEKLFSKATTVAPERAKNTIKGQFENYSSAVLSTLINLKNNAEKSINQLSTEFERKKATLQNQISALETAKKNVKDPTKILFWALSIVVIALTVYSLLGGIFAALGVLLLFGGMGYGIWRLGCFFLLPSYNKKIKNYDNQIISLKNKLEQENKIYTHKINLLYESIRKAGDV